MITEGLKRLPWDERDFQMGQLVKLPQLNELPAEFILNDPFPVLNQQDSDFCTQYSCCGASQLQEGVELEPAWSFAMSKILSGGVDEFGQDLRVAMKTHVKYGAIKAKDAPFSIDTKPSFFLRRAENWPDSLKQLASTHKKKSYVFISGPYDAFDNIRATIWKFRNENRAVVFGALWNWPIGEASITTPAVFGSGHAMFTLGWKQRNGEPMLYIKQSYGTSAGENGYHYFSRSVINENVAKYGAGMFVDLSKEEIQYYLSNGILLTDNWFIGIFKALWKTFFKR